MRKWTYLVAALLMAGATTTFTGCIDNDEPAGIENLRGAKAELLKAKAAVQLANAAYIDAETQLKLVEVEKEKLMNEKLKLNNELSAANNELTIANIKAQLLINQAKWDAQLLKEKEALAWAEKHYADAMEAIKLAQTYLSTAELAQLEAVKMNLNNAKAEAYGGTPYTYKVTTKPDGSTVYEYVPGNPIVGAQADLKTAYDTYERIVKKPGNYINEASLKEALADAQTKLDKASNKLAVKMEALAALESDDAYNAWIALKGKYNAKVDSLNSVLANKKTAEAKIIAENTNGVIATLEKAIKKVEGETSVLDGGLVKGIDATVASGKDSTFTVSAAISTDLNSGDFAGFLAYNNGEITAKFNAGSKVLAIAKSEKEVDRFDKGENGSAENYSTLLDNTYAFADGYDADGTTPKYDYTKAIVNIDASIKKVNEAKAAIATLDTEKAEALKKAAQKNLDAAKEAKTKAITAWSNSITAWKAVENYTTENADKKAVVDAQKAYDDAMTAAAGDAKKELKAQQAFADAIVKYYNAAAPLQLTSNKVTLKLTIGGKDSYITKTVKEWLSDSENKDVYLAALITYFNDDATKLWEKGSKETVEAGAAPSVKATGALATLKNKADIQEEWMDASVALYGTQLGKFNTEGRETEPTTAEIEKVWNNSLITDAATNPAGHYGVVLTREVLLKTATENVGKAAQFDKVVAQLNSWKASLGTLKTAYVAKNQATIDAVTAAQKAVVEKVSTPIKELGIEATDAMLTDIKLVIAEIDGTDTDIANYETVIEALKAEIYGTDGTGNKDGLKFNVKDAKDGVLEAEKMLELFNAGNLSVQYVIDWAKEDLDRVKATYESKVSIFNYWNAKLEEMTKTLYNNAK